MPIYEYKCSDCKGDTSVILSIKEYEQVKVICEGCGSANLTRRFSVPAIKIGGSGSYERDIAGMKQSFKEHFVKSGEMDQVAHKHGKEFTDSLVGAAANRVRNNEEPI